MSKKSGVVATLVLESGSGTVIQRGGSIGSIGSSYFASTAQKTPAFDSAEAESAPNAETDVDRFAAMVWNFVNAAGGLVKGLDPEV